jgi:Kef-type K+ transport system membrane component KefB
MKRLFVVAGLLVLMLGLRALGTADESGGGALTLAAIGFVILAAFAIAELLARAGLPKVTGYILSGVVLGPHIADVLSLDVVTEMRMFNTLAVGLIALTAGLELEVQALRKLARTLGATTLAKLMITVPLVGATLIGIELVFHVLDSPDSNTTIALGLVFGALAVGTSPSISLAIISETRARGRLTELVLGAAVLKDLVVVVFLALAIAAAHTMVSGGTFGADVLVHVGEELGLSILAGAAVGGLLIAYVRFIKAEMLLFVAALVLVVAELAEALHLELLLVCIVAGFVVRNFSDYEHDLLPPLQLVSLPVFVVFFTIAGASVDLSTAIALLPLALALCLVRIGGYWISARIGNRFGGETEAVSKNAWLAYIPQAGVTLGLIGIAVDRLPELASWIGSLGMAVVSINLFIGPLTLRTALKRAGDIPDEQPETLDAERPLGEGETASEVPAIELEDARLEARIRELHGRLDSRVEQTIAGFVGPWLALRRQRFTALPADAGPGTIDELAEAHPPPDALGFSRTLAKLFEQGATELEALEHVTEVAMESPWWLPPAREAPVQMVRRVLRHSAARIGHRRSGRRQIPLRLAARTAYEPRLATAMLELLRASCRCDARVAELMRRRLDDTLAADELVPAIAAVLDDFATAAREIPRTALASANRAMRQIAARIDSPVMSARSLDFSEVSGSIERELVALQQEAEAWPAIIDACWQSVAVAARVHVLHEQLAGGRAAVGELERASEAIAEELGAFERRVGELREAVEQSPNEAERDDLLANLSMRCLGLLPKPAAKRLRQLEPRLRRLAELRSVRQGVRELFARETGPRPLASAVLAASAPVPARLRVREIDVRELIDGEVSGRLLPRTQQRIEAAAVHLDESVQAAATIVGDIELLLEVYRARESGESDFDTLRTSLDRILLRASELHGRALTELQTIGQAIAEDFDGLAERLAGALDEATAASEAAHWVSRRADRARLEFGRSLTELRERVTGAWTELVRRISTAAASLSEDYRLRSGQALLSANEIAAMLPGPPSHLPREYAALFTEQAIRDPRFFVANREALRCASKAERGWIDGSSGNGMLVIGGPGTGKTSLLAVAQLKLATREIVWLPVHARGLIEALASELRSPAREQLVLRRLQDRKRVVIIDDLQRLLPPGPEAGAELERLIRLIAATSGTCFWLVSISRELQRLVEPLIGLRVAFAAVVELEDGRDIDELENAVIARHRISGKPLTYPPAPRLRGLLTRIPGVRMRSQERQFFTRLADVSKGNLRAALAEWCRRAEVQGDALVLAPTGRSRGLPFVRQLPAPALSVLATLLRFGPCRSADLAKALSIAPDELARWLHFLGMAGLIAGDEHDGYHCPARVRDQLAPELIELQVFHGGVG